MNTGIYIIGRRMLGNTGIFFCNTGCQSAGTAKIFLPHSKGDGQFSKITFTEKEKDEFLTYLKSTYGYEESDFKVHPVYFNKNDTMIILDEHK